jgi:isopenicillin-N epimerase
MANEPARPATFGHPVRALWPLEDETIYLNHGTVGVTPTAVLEAQTALRLEIERQPARFLLRELKDRLRATATLAARRFGGDGDDYVFVDNATTAINAVLRSCELGPGDEVLITDHAYGAIDNAAAYACRKSGARLVRAQIPFPLSEPGEAVAALRSKLTARTKLVMLDHITSETALLLPLEEMIGASREAGAAVLVDGAHVPGQIRLDIPALGADWYTGNLHKWHFTPRGCAILWTTPERQADLHPAVISWRLDEGYTAEFDWVGTKDPTPALCFAAAVSFLDSLGAAEVWTYNHDLVRQAAGMFAARFAGPVAPPEMTGAMTLAPLPAGCDASGENASMLQHRLREEHGLEVKITTWADRLWARISAQVYCEIGDFEALAQAVAEEC